VYNSAVLFVPNVIIIMEAQHSIPLSESPFLLWEIQSGKDNLKDLNVDYRIILTKARRRVVVACIMTGAI
jgi:hypothetical protein